MGGLHGPAVGASALLPRAELWLATIPLDSTRASTACAASSPLGKASLQAAGKQARLGPGAAVAMQTQRMQKLPRKEASALAQGVPELGEDVGRTLNQRLGAAAGGRALESQPALEGLHAGPHEPGAQPSLRSPSGLGSVAPSEAPKADGGAHTPAAEGAHTPAVKGTPPPASGASSSQRGTLRKGPREAEDEGQGWGRWRQREYDLFDGARADLGEPPPTVVGSFDDCRACDTSQILTAEELHRQNAAGVAEVAAVGGWDQGTSTAGASVVGAGTHVPALGQEALLQSLDSASRLQTPQSAPALQRPPGAPLLVHPHAPQLAQAQDDGTQRVARKDPTPGTGDSTPSLLVFSGGTAFNAIAEELRSWTTSVAHVLPVSDNGGSTSEIVRVIGGPAIGDIRSRCLRLSDGSSAESLAVKRLLGHRLPLEPRLAKAEWLSIVEGEHELWNGLSEPYKDTIRAFLVHFQHQILRCASQGFCFQNGSVGNFFFAGARSFFRSLDAAIFLFSRVSHIPAQSLVLPCVCTNDRLTLGAELQDGGIIRGQNEISHPAVRDSPCQLPTSMSHLAVNKAHQASPPLPAPIQRVFYMSSDGTNLLHEVFPPVNPRILEQLRTVDAVVYGVGSLYTSICPSLLRDRPMCSALRRYLNKTCFGRPSWHAALSLLWQVLRGVGEGIAARSCPKVLLLNGSHDRETRGMSAADFVSAICHALNRTHGEDSRHRLRHNCGLYVTHLLVPEGGAIEVDTQRLKQMGVADVRVVKSAPVEGGVLFDVKALIQALKDLLSECNEQ